MKYLTVGTREELCFFDEVADGEMLIAYEYPQFCAINKQDAEKLIAHLQQAFNIGDKQDD